MNISFNNATPHKLSFNCPSCSEALSMTVPWQVNATLNTEKMTFDSACPVCGTVIALPGGKYESQDGELVRVGDYQKNA